MRNVDTIFALEFGQLLENHLFASPNRDEELEIICSSLNRQYHIFQSDLDLMT